MKLCRYQDSADGPVKLGVVRGAMIHDVTAVTERLPSVRWPYPAGDLLIAHLDELRPEMERLADSATPIPREQVLLRCPTADGEGEVMAQRREAALDMVLRTVAADPSKI